MLQCLMIVGGVSFCVPTLQFHPADCASLAPNPFSSHTLSSLFFSRPARRALFCSSESHSLSFPYFTHSLRLYPGVSPDAFFQLSVADLCLRKSFRISTYSQTPRRVSGFVLANLGQQTTEISRNRPPTSPLESTLTRLPFVTPLESALTKKG